MVQKQVQKQKFSHYVFTILVQKREFLHHDLHHESMICTNIGFLHHHLQKKVVFAPSIGTIVVPQAGCVCI